MMNTRELYKHGTPEERANIRDDAIDNFADSIYWEILTDPYAFSEDLAELAYKIAEREFDDLEESYRHDVPY